jgi:hypothetical protein
MSALLFYKKDYNLQGNLYDDIQNKLNNYILKSLKYVNDPIKKQKNIRKLLLNLEFAVRVYPERSTMILKMLGMWSLPPPEIFLIYIAKLIFDNDINTIIDYGAGVGLWSRVIYDYTNINVIAYDLNIPTNNINTNKQRGYHNITTEINLSEYNNSILMLICPYEINIMDVVEKFMGKYIIYCGESTKLPEINENKLTDDESEASELDESELKELDKNELNEDTFDKNESDKNTFDKNTFDEDTFDKDESDKNTFDKDESDKDESDKDESDKDESEDIILEIIGFELVNVFEPLEKLMLNGQTYENKIYVYKKIEL